MPWEESPPQARVMGNNLVYIKQSIHSETDLEELQGSQIQGHYEKTERCLHFVKPEE